MIGNDFNSLFHRPPNFCSDCGNLMNFEIIKDNYVICQVCGNNTLVDQITNHVVEVKSEYNYSKAWKNKLHNIEDKKKKKQELVRTTVIIIFILD